MAFIVKLHHRTDQIRRCVYAAPSFMLHTFSNQSFTKAYTLIGRQYFLCTTVLHPTTPILHYALVNHTICVDMMYAYCSVGGHILSDIYFACDVRAVYLYTDLYWKVETC